MSKTSASTDPDGVVLVTGGNRGIGRAVVEGLVADGRRVAFSWRSGEAEAQEIQRALGEQVRAYHLDLTDRQRPAELIDEIEAQMGPLEGLVNNAGMQRSELLAMTSDASWDEVLDINLGGAFRCSRSALKVMIRRRRGAIVNLSSLSAQRGVAGLASYAASKAGILAMTRCLAREMGKRGIRINAVVPGFVPTDLTESLPERAITGLRATECLPRGTDTRAVADAVIFLLSEKAAAVTGQTLVVDAGASA